MSLLAGYCAYAYFEHCDPYTSQWIGARDQILPYLSLYMFATVAPGLAGVYMSAVFGATLSTTSSKSLKAMELKYSSARISIY